MALTVRGDGTGTAFQVNSSWWNEYHDLLTGAMTDQPVSLYYAPGSSGSTPVLKLRTNNNADLMQGFDGANNQVFTLARTGHIAISESITATQFRYNTNLGGSNKEILYMNPADMTNQWGLFYRTDGNLAFFEAVNNKTTLTLKANGDVTVAGNLGIGSLFTGPNGSQIQMGANASGDIIIVPGTGWTKFNNGGSTWIDNNGNYRNPGGYGIVLGNDNNTGTKVVRIYIGTTDPSTYATVNDGDIWIKG